MTSARTRKEPSMAIHVWRWCDAPESLKRAAGGAGGDEDWLALVPVELKDYPISWMQEGGPFGCCSVHEYELPGGCVVRVGTHS